MHWLDWTIMLGTLGFIVGFGIWRTRKTNTTEGFLRGGSNDKWWGVGLSVMATQASAITFLSTPGQGYLDGMGFVQFYFGLPLAMIVIGAVFIPLYYKWKVFTAYEFIGKRFDNRMRLFTAMLFLISRGLAAGITIYAPSIILSKMLGWPLSWTCVFIGGLVILYTTTGGAKAVGVTHRQQMTVMFLGIFLTFSLLIYYLSDTLSFGESIQLADTLGKMNVVDTSWDPSTKYTLWSGLLGGFFLQLSYFGTDQSQVQRYLSGKSMEQARMGLWMNGLLKIPMQFFILLTGVLVFVFYLFNAAPMHWNNANTQMLQISPAAPELQEAQGLYDSNREVLGSGAINWLDAHRSGNEQGMFRADKQMKEALAMDKVLREGTNNLILSEQPDAEVLDKDYIFVTFVMDNLPIGVVGLLLAMIFSAGMSSTSAELSALATTSTVDVFRGERSDEQQVRATKLATIAFGILALCFAAIFSLFENLIQAVNILGSLFYGTILGIFLVGFFLKHVQGKAVFIAALIAQATIFYIHFTGVEIAFLWYNLIAPAVVVFIALGLQPLLRRVE